MCVSDGQAFACLENAGDGECEGRHARHDEELDELERRREHRAEHEHPERLSDACRVLRPEHLVRDGQVDACTQTQMHSKWTAHIVRSHALTNEHAYAWKMRAQNV